MQNQNFLPHPQRLAMAVRTALLALPMAAVCATPFAAHAQAAAQATAQPVHDFDIPAGPLSTSLTRAAARAGVALTADAALTAGKSARALQGRMTLHDALVQLLAGSGLSAVADGKTLVIRPIPVSSRGGETMLAPVKVTAQSVKDGSTDGTTEDTGSFTTRRMSSATHLPLSMRETPQSVTVLTSARIEADNLVDLVDIAKATPGLMVGSSDIRPVLYSRGYQVENMTQDGIAIQYDWYGGDSLGNLAMQDRIEVVRGSTGLMQGAGNPSAAVNMIRKRPTSTWQFKGSASVGSWDDHRLMADVSGPLTEDGRIRGRVVGYGQEASDFYDLAFNDKRLGYVTVDIDLTERTTLNIGYSNLHSNKNLNWGGMPTGYGFQHLNLPRSTFIGTTWEYNKNEVDTFYASLAHDFGAGWKLNFNGTYVDGRYDILATALIPTPAVGGYGHSYWGRQTSRKQNAADLNISGPVSWFGRTHDLAFGATVNRQDSRISEGYSVDDTDLLTSGVDLTTWNHTAPRPDSSKTSLYNYPTNYKQDSLYSAGKFNVADTLSLLLGARLDWYDRRGDPWSGMSIR